MKNKILLIALISATSLSAASTVPQVEFSNMRQKAMGGVGIGASSDSTALVNNPAGLVDAKFQFTMPRINIDGSEDYKSKQSVLNDMMEDSNDEVDQLRLLKGLKGLRVGAKGGVMPGLSLTAKGFGVGAFAGSNFVGKFNQDTSLTVEGHADVVPAIAYARNYNLFGTTSIGISAKYINRLRTYDKQTGSETIEYTPAELLKFFNEDANRKEVGTYTLTGVGIDLGMLRSMETDWLGKGRWGLAIQNIGTSISGDKDLTYQSNGATVNETSSISRDIPLTATIGFASNSDLLSRLPYVGKTIGNVTLAADYKLISPHEDFKKNVHLGIEKEYRFLAQSFKLRGGVNQGYIVGGLGLDIRVWKIPLIHLDYARYTEELGEKVGYDKIDYQAFQIGILF